MSNNDYFSLREEDPKLYKKVLIAVNDLKIKGYAVITNIINEERRKEYLSMMWDMFESMGGQYDVDKLDRNIESYSKHSMSNLLPHKHGIIESYRINHCEAAREARKEKKILQVFSSIYGSTRLVCSLDRINWKFPGKPYKSQKE